MSQVNEIHKVQAWQLGKGDFIMKSLKFRIGYIKVADGICVLHFADEFETYAQAQARYKEVCSCAYNVDEDNYCFITPPIPVEEEEPESTEQVDFGSIELPF
jgi:hypothetical protein